MKNVLVVFLFSLHGVWGSAYALKELPPQEIQNLKLLAEKNASVSKKLGLMYFKGIGVLRNKKLGLHYLEQAAELGDKEVLNFLIKSYSKPESPFYSPKKTKYLLSLRDGKTEKKSVTPFSKDKNFFLGWKNESIDLNRIKNTGSGFAINKKGFFLTNEHVVDSCKKVIIEYNGFANFADIVRFEKKYDLAVLRVTGTTPYYIVFSGQTGRIGEKVFAAGYPRQTFKLSEGIIGSIVKEKFLIPGLELIQISASFSSGNSGGPVIDSYGSLLGVATGKNEAGIIVGEDGTESVRGDDYNFAVSNRTMKKFLDSSNIDYIVSKKIKKTEFDSVQLAKFLGRTSCIVLCYGK